MRVSNTVTLQHDIVSSWNFNWAGARLLITWPGSKRKEKDGLCPMISCKGTDPRTWRSSLAPASFMFHQLPIIPSWRLSHQNMGLCGEFKIHVAGLEGCFSGYEHKQLLQMVPIQSPALARQLPTSWNSTPKESGICGLRYVLSCTHMPHRYP